MTTVKATGQTGTIEFDGQFVTITRDGWRGKAVFGKGEKRIPVRSITAVQFKPAGALTQGFIQFTISGGSEKTGGRSSRTQEAFTDENSVVFLRKSLAGFEAVRDAVNAAIAADGQPSATPDLADQLSKLAALRDQGILTPEEFEAKKADILERM